MASMTTELIDILNVQREKYEKLVECAILKRDCLISNKIEKLNNITNEEQVLITDLNRSEKKRKVLFTNLALVLNEKELTLGKLLSKIPDNERIQFEEIKVKLTECIGKLTSINTENTILINEGINYTEYALNALRGDSFRENSYTNDFKESLSAASARHFDSKR